jgi:nitroreductase
MIDIKSSSEVGAFFKAHWTVRKYKNYEMPNDHVEAILYAAQRAPTDATAQMYSFIRLTDPKIREQAAALSMNVHVATASMSFVVCADIHRLKLILETKGLKRGNFPRVAVHFAIGDAVMAGQNLLIAAEMLGYRGCWIGGVLNNLAELSRLLQLPEGVLPFAGLTIGVPDEDPKERPRLPRSQVIHENFYQDPPNGELLKAIEEMGPITARGDWAGTLARYFAEGGGMEEREIALHAYLAAQGFQD